MPFVLYPTEDYHRLMGHCYVHGVMSGEAFPEYPNERRYRKASFLNLHIILYLDKSFAKGIETNSRIKLSNESNYSRRHNGQNRVPHSL